MEGDEIVRLGETEQSTPVWSEVCHDCNRTLPCDEVNYMGDKIQCDCCLGAEARAQRLADIAALRSASHEITAQSGCGMLVKIGWRLGKSKRGKPTSS